jgi:phosphoenolpyruvate-protein phosphotransferase
MLRLLEAVHFLRESSNEQQSFDFHSQKMILVAKELLPSDLLRLPVEQIAGLICEKGGATSHVAILTRALEIPALLGAAGIMDQVNNFDQIILDCHAERVYINPSEKLKSNFNELLSAASEPEPKIATGACVTSDGVRVFLRANISLICETPLLQKYGADGIGLYRTEFLFIIREYQPAEDIQYKVFSKVVAACKGEITLRVLDAGGDKQLNFLNMPHEENPALGVRGIRLLMSYPDIFKTHLRAILRAGVNSRLKILFPMISSVDELLAIRVLLQDVENELTKENINFSSNYQFGMMLEVPVVLTGLRHFIPHVDFFSIGTNDLQQYLFAAERGRAKESAHDCLNPLFLETLVRVAKTLSKHPEKGLSVCGEMAGNALAAPLLLGAGIYELSMPPKLMPKIRSAIGAFSFDECKSLLKKSLRKQNAAEVTELMKAAFKSKKLDLHD